MPVGPLKLEGGTVADRCHHGFGSAALLDQHVGAAVQVLLDDSAVLQLHVDDLLDADGTYPVAEGDLRGGVDEQQPVGVRDGAHPLERVVREELPQDGRGLRCSRLSVARLRQLLGREVDVVAGDRDVAKRRR